MRHCKLLLIVILGIFLSPIARGDWLHTIDGKVYEGKMVAFKYGTIFFNVYKFGKFHSSKRFPLFTVWKIEFNEPKKDNLETSFEIESKYAELRRGKRVRKIILNGDQAWINTGISLTIGKEILFSVSGSIYIDEKTKVFHVGELNVNWSQNKPMPNQPTGAVIAKIGEKGNPFYVGDDKAPFPITRKGTLYIGINDYKLDDNSGQFTVTIYY
jgi:hypothetical protein